MKIFVEKTAEFLFYTLNETTKN